VLNVVYTGGRGRSGGVSSGYPGPEKKRHEDGTEGGQRRPGDAGDKGIRSEKWRPDPKGLSEDKEDRPECKTRRT